MTLVVLALDAVDIRLAKRFGAENLMLDNYVEFETLAHAFEYPHTGEAWPSIATGLHPSDHGVTGQGQWDNPVLTLLSRLAHRLNVSGDLRSRLGDAIKEMTGQTWNLQLVDEATFLDGEYRAVHNWPGVYRNESIRYIWGLYQKLMDGELSEATHIREAYTEAASKFGWLHEAIEHEGELAATHVHTIDIFGHLYFDDEDRYREVYADVDEWVGELRAALGDEDELLLLSDHGMQVSWFDDVDPGEHSWHPIASTTLDAPPEDALSVKSWVEDNVETVSTTRTEVDVPEEQLKDLGYIE